MTLLPLKQWTRPAAAALLIAVAGGCATPVRVTSLGRNYAYEQIDRCALNSKTYSSYTANVLHRYDLEGAYAKSPLRGLIQLHALACSDTRRDALFALAELAFLEGKRGSADTVDGHRLTSRNYYAAAVAYAYLFLTGADEGNGAIAFDRRFRIACDLTTGAWGTSSPCGTRRRSGSGPNCRCRSVKSVSRTDTRIFRSRFRSTRWSCRRTATRSTGSRCGTARAAWARRSLSARPKSC